MESVGTNNNNYITSHILYNFQWYWNFY